VGIAGDVARYIGRAEGKSIEPQRAGNDCLRWNEQRGDRRRGEGECAMVGTLGRVRAKSICQRRTCAVMLSGAAAACGNRLLRLEQGHNKSCQGQEEQQAGKDSAHGQKDFTTSQGCVIDGQTTTDAVVCPENAGATITVGWRKRLMAL
jgi:hypothetical protein